MEKIPKKQESKEHKVSLNEPETLAYLIERGVQPLKVWEKEKPFLYVMEDVVRGDDGPFQMLATQDRPSIARVNGPTDINFDKPVVSDDQPNRVGYHMSNPGSQIDYFAIDGLTRNPQWVRTTFRDTRNSNFRYVVRKEYLFETDNTLFPQQNIKKEDILGK
jgi:hypothetical protein